MNRIVVTSQNQVKLCAVKRVFNELYPDCTNVVSGVKCNVDTMNQPLGINNTFKDGMKRIEYLVNSNPNNTDPNVFIVSIESGLVNIESLYNYVAHDVATVTVRYNNKIYRGYHTIEVPLPAKYHGYDFMWKLTLDYCKDSPTLGEILNKLDPKIPAGSWMDVYGSVTRDEQIGHALTDCLTPLVSLQKIKDRIAYYPNFPKPGVLFQDIFPVVREELGSLSTVIKETCQNRDFEYVAGLESRGFIVGMIVAHICNKKFIPIRKANKLPGDKYTVHYGTEYSKDVFQLAHNVLPKDSRVMLADDLLATGGSLKGAVDLVKMAGGVVDSCFILTHVPDLLEKAKEKLQGYEIITLI